MQRERDQSLRPIIIIILIIITIHIFGGIQVLNVCQGSTQSRNAYGKIEVYLVVAMLQFDIVGGNENLKKGRSNKIKQCFSLFFFFLD